MLNRNYYIVVNDFDSYSSFVELLKKRYENLQLFYEKESLIKSIEFLSQNQSFIDHNIFVIFADTECVCDISKYLKENLDDLNYVLLSFGYKKSAIPACCTNLFDFIQLSDAPVDEALIFNRLEAEIVRINRMTASKLQLQQFYEIGKLLSSERDILKLFDTIINASMNITTSDAVTLYLVTEKETGEWSSIENNDYSNKLMKFVISKNMSINTDYEAFTIPITRKSITGYTAIYGKALRIDDAYHISPEMEYNHDSSFDKLTGYRTISMLSVPMKDRNNNIAGVVQLINKKKDSSFIDYRDKNWIHKIIPFDYFDELTMNSIAGQAAVALENNLLYKNINSLLKRYKEQNEKLTVLSSKILKAHEEERKRIARDIHDGPAQSVACLALKMELCKKQLQNNAYEALTAQLDRLGDDVRSSVKEIRTIIYDLKPTNLDDGLFTALGNYIENFEENTKLEVNYRTVGEDRNIEYYIASTLFRIVQEALTNISKHAKASKVNISLKILKNALVLAVEDDGKGFDTAILKNTNHEEITKGFGIEGMIERVGLIKGIIDISSAPGAGTNIKIDVPLE